MTFSNEIYKRLDFGINILDEPDGHISVQEIEVSVATRKDRKRRISDDLSQEDSNSVSLVRKPWKEVRLWKETDESQRINYNVKNDGAFSNTFFPSGG